MGTEVVFGLTAGSHKECSGMQLGIEEIRYVWINPMESLIPPSLHQVHTGCSWPHPSLCTKLALTRVIYVPLGQWHLVIDNPSCHCISEAQSLMGLQRALRTERSSMSDKTEKIASHSQKGGKGSTGGYVGDGKKKEFVKETDMRTRSLKWNRDDEALSPPQEPRTSYQPT